jgi:membrane-associated phospholipid phosphatase
MLRGKTLNRAMPIGLSLLWAFGTICQGQTTPQSDIRDRNIFSLDDGIGKTGKKMVTNILLDQRDIWVSPFRMTKSNSQWWLVFGTTMAALIATDHHISEQLPNHGLAVSVGNNISRAGQYYSVYPFALGLYIAGYKWQNKKLAGTGVLATQALIDAAIVSNVLKEVTGRDRPLEGDGGGHFGKGGASFPSGHSIEAWSLATVVASRYRNHKWISLASYGYAIAISGSRVAGRQHFVSDVVAGAAMGFFIGKHVVAENDLHSAHAATSHAWWREPRFVPVVSGSEFGGRLIWDLSDGSKLNGTQAY